MRPEKMILAAALAALCLSCGRSDSAVEEGVSLSLARFRSGKISNVRYRIGFRIPQDPSDPVSGRDTVLFDLSERVSVQLDFRAESEPPSELIVNGLPREIDYRDEHLVLDRRWLRKGENSVSVSFVSSDRSLNRSPDHLYTLFVPDRARTAFPCFDQPDLKGRFTLSLEVPSQWEAVANGEEVSVAESDGVKKVRFKETEPLSTYLFAFVAGRWRKETRLRGSEPMSVYFRETDPLKIAQVDEIFSQVFQSLDWLEEYTLIPRPFGKYDLVIVPGFQFGGMEHPGVILYSDKRMFLGQNPTTSERLSRINLIAHETSHLWFGDAVTMLWFDDVWTKEVFANYFAAAISSPLFPEVNTPLRDFKSFTMTAWSEDRTLGTNLIRQPLDNLSRAGLVYGNIVYDKAPVVMRMLADILGQEAFRDGIREYLQTYMYSNATWDDLIGILDKRTDVDLKRWSRVWVDEKGMPVMTYSVRDGMLTLRQEDPFGRGLVWPQRVSFSDPSGRSVSIWADADSVSVALPPGAGEDMLPNTDALAYGWFRLDERQVMAATDALFSFREPQSRLSLLATLYENALRGAMNSSLLPPLLDKVIHSEADPLVTSAALSYLEALSIHGPLAGDSGLENILRDAAIDAFLPEETRLYALRALFGTFRSEESATLLWNVFLDGGASLGLSLSTRDRMNLSYELALRMPERFEMIRADEEGRLTNEDLSREFRFVYRAVDPSKESRDSLFNSLLAGENRLKEPWVCASLKYLNHPLRQMEALSYIMPALEELPQIQRTGDIFFPKNWATNLLRGHNSPAAAEVVRQYLDDHPELNPSLRCKLLQSADHLLRAQFGE